MKKLLIDNMGESDLYLKEISNIPVLTDEEFDTLIIAAKNGDKEARDKIVIHNLRLVVTVAKRFLSVETSLSFMDLVMEGNIGLYHAIEHFEPDKGCKFSTYAWSWIRKSMMLAMTNTGHAIRFPLHITEFLRKYRDFLKVWQQEYEDGVYPSKEVIMEQIPALTDETYEIMVNAYKASSIYSLNKAATTEISESSEFLEFMISDSGDMAIRVEHEELSKELNRLIELYATNYTKTPDKTKDIIYRRFGFNGYDVHTLAAIGEYYGCTREAVRRVEANFINFCRAGQTYSVLKNYR